MEKEIEEFRRLAQQISDALPEYINHNKRNLNIPFPRRVIRKLSDVNNEDYPYLSEDQLHTVGCVLQLSDILTWNLQVWDISLTAGSMWEWHASLQIINLIEFLTIQYTDLHFPTKNNTFNKSIDTLYENGVITPPLKDELHSLRTLRNNQHLRIMGSDVKEVKKTFRVQKFNRSIRALRTVRKRLAIHHHNIQEPL